MKPHICEYFEDIHQIVLDGISDNVDFLVQYGKYGAMNTTDTTTMSYYFNRFFPGAYNLQEYNACDIQVSTSGKMFVKAHYFSCIQGKTKLNWDEKQQQ